MDFGLGKYLEMFEERFGRKPTTALISLLTVALVSLCIHTIYADAALPLYHVAVAIAKNQSLSAIIQGGLFSLITTIVFCFVVSQLVVRLVLRKYKAFQQELLNNASELQSLSKQVRGMYLARTGDCPSVAEHPAKRSIE